MSSIGMIVWCVAVLGTAVSQDFWTLIIARTLTGIGEAAFVAVSSTIVDAIAPPEKRSAWLASYYISLPVGYAFGYGVGGQISTSGAILGDNHSWRLIFVLEACLVAPVCLLLCCITGPKNMLVIDPSRIQREDDETVWVKVKKLAKNHVYMWIIFGYITQTFVVGGLSNFTLKYLQDVYDLSESKGGVIFGIITVITGIGGTAGGGFILDKFKSEYGENPPETKLIKSGIKVIWPLSVLAFPLSLILWSFHNIYGFCGLVFIVEMLIFATVGPINSCILWSLPHKDRPFGMAMSTLGIHAFGDAISPAAIGALKDSKGWNFAMFIASLWLVGPVIFFILAYKSLGNLDRILADAWDG